MKFFPPQKLLARKAGLAGQRSKGLTRPEFDPAKHIHNSEVHTLAYQNKLPKQPIPPLDSTGKQCKTIYVYICVYT